MEISTKNIPPGTREDGGRGRVESVIFVRGVHSLLCAGGLQEWGH